MNYNPVEDALLADIVAPTVAVTAGRWVDAAGAQIAVTGARAYGVAFSDFSATDVANASKTPATKLTVTILGFAEVELGAQVNDRTFCTTDNVGRTVPATNANDEVLCFVPKGDTAAGKRVRALVLKNYDTRQPAAAVTDLTNTFGTGDGAIADVGAAFNQTTLNNNFRDVSDKINAVLAALRLQKIIS